MSQLDRAAWTATEKVVRWLLIAAHAFRVVAGETSLRKWQPDGGGEMVPRRLRLVALCRKRRHDGPIGIRMRAFDSDPGMRPRVHQLVAYTPAWEPLPDDGLPHHLESRHKLHLRAPGPLSAGTSSPVGTTDARRTDTRVRFPPPSSAWLSHNLVCA